MGSLSEVDLGGHAHAFDNYMTQCNKPVRVKLPSRKHVMYSMYFIEIKVVLSEHHLR